MLVFCGPFYYFLDHLGKQVAHNFKGDTPLIDAMLVTKSPYFTPIWVFTNILTR